MPDHGDQFTFPDDKTAGKKTSVLIATSTKLNRISRAYQPIVKIHARPGVAPMSKFQKSNKESKKQSALTPKEKKAAKRDKKKAGGHVPFVIKDN
jgi:hypothetical protein